MRSNARYIIWFALLMGMPPFFMRTSANMLYDVADIQSFSTYYWFMALVGVFAWLLPEHEMGHLGTGSFQPIGDRVGRRWVGTNPSPNDPSMTRSVWERIARCTDRIGLGVAALLYALSFVGSVVWPHLPLEVKLFLLALPLWTLCFTVLPLCSVMVLVLSFRRYIRREPEDDRGGYAQIPLIGACAIVGIFRMVLAAPFALVSAYAVGIATASADVAAMGSLLVPALALCALGAAAARWGGARGFATLFAGLMYGEALGHVLLRLFPNAVFVALDHIPLCALACAAVFAAGLAASRLLKQRCRPETRVDHNDHAEQEYEIQNAWRLSDREREVVVYALEGVSSRAASESMGISASTVRNLQSRAWAKMGVSSVAEARELARREAAPVAAADADDALYARWRFATEALALCVFAGMFPWHAREAVWFTPLNVCATLSVVAIGPFLASRLSGPWGGTIRSMRIRTVVLAACIVAECAAQALCIDALPIVMLASALAMADALVVLDAVREDSAFPAVTACCLVVIAAVLGLSLFVFWKGSVWPFIAPVEQFLLLIGFLAVCTVGMLAYLGRTALSVALALCLIGSIAAAQLIENYALILVVLAGTVAGMVVELHRSGYVGRFSHALLGGLSVGGMIGVGPISWLYDEMNIMLVTDRVIAERQAQLAFSFVLGIAVALAAIALAVLWAEVVASAHRDAVGNEFSRLPADRAVNALRARGLSDLQVDVLIGSLEGKTLKQIAASVNYSSSTVYTVRRDAYRALGVRGIGGVLSIIQQVTGL